MDVILLERIEKLGQMGDVVSVKAGYARNYLLPQKKALRATRENMSHFESRRAQLEADNLERRHEAQLVAGKADGVQVILIRQASEGGQLYGSVTVRDIAEAVTEAGFTIERRQVALDRPIKTLGLHPVRVRLHPEVSITVVANVAPSRDEAEAQARAAMGGEVGAGEEGIPGTTPEDQAEVAAPASEAAVDETPGSLA
jgi:large subunit ribosomal protein L9